MVDLKGIGPVVLLHYREEYVLYGSYGSRETVCEADTRLDYYSNADDAAAEIAARIQEVPGASATYLVWNSWDNCLADAASVIANVTVPELPPPYPPPPPAPPWKWQLTHALALNTGPRPSPWASGSFGCHSCSNSSLPWARTSGDLLAM